MTVLFFAPFVSSAMRIDPAWIDRNGHLNMAYYNVLFDLAVDEAFALVGLSAEYAEERQGSYFTAEHHILYRREVGQECLLRITLQLVDFDEKRMHYAMEMRHASEGWVAASAESLALHVDLKTRKVTPFPPDILANLAIMKAAHAGMATPEALGRIISMKPKNRDPAEAPTIRAGKSRLLN
jgi:acyl-CoA thioester hydrolase